MGCDIHVYTEKRLIDGTWWCTDRFYLNPDYDGNDESEPEYLVDNIYNRRDYNLFGTLAGVRNYDGVTPIDEPRGLPHDVSNAVKKEYELYKCDWHTPSWFTARELFQYKAKRPFYKESGMVSPTDAFYLDELGRLPREWCIDTTDESWVRREWLVPYSTLDDLIEAIKKRMAEEFYIYDFFSEAEREEKFAKYSKDFRIVFWFDS